MIRDMKKALSLIKFTATKRSVIPMAVIYVLFIMWDVTLYHQLVLIPMIIGMTPYVLLQFIYGAEVFTFVLSGADRKNTIIRGTCGVVGVIAVLSYALAVVMLIVEDRLAGIRAMGGFSSLTVLTYVAVLAFIMLFVGPWMYRKYILSMICFMPVIFVTGIFGVFQMDHYSVVIDASGKAVQTVTFFGVELTFASMAIVGFVLVLLGIFFFVVNSYLAYKFPMDWLAFRQMFKEKKKKK